jgi:hypothetical protein
LPWSICPAVPTMTDFIGNSVAKAGQAHLITGTATVLVCVPVCRGKERYKQRGSSPGRSRFLRAKKHSHIEWIENYRTWLVARTVGCGNDGSGNAGNPLVGGSPKRSCGRVTLRTLIHATFDWMHEVGCRFRIEKRCGRERIRSTASRFPRHARQYHDRHDYSRNHS